MEVIKPQINILDTLWRGAEEEEEEEEEQIFMPDVVLCNDMIDDEYDEGR